MAIIEAVGLRKVFRSVERAPGIGGAIAALFSRTYDEKVAVDDVNFALAPGELVGYIGPNGAGKSTTIKMLTGILVPTSGTLRVAGIVPYAHRMANAREHRRRLRPAQPALLGPAAARVVRAAALDLRRAARPLRGEHAALRRDPRPRTVPRARRCASSRSASGCAATSRPRCCTTPRSCISTSRRSASTSSPRRRSASSSAEINRERGTTVILTTHDLADVERLSPPHHPHRRGHA